MKGEHGMRLVYESFSVWDADAEIAKIRQADEVAIRFDNTRREHLFLLGLLFASGKKLAVLNADACDMSVRSYFQAACHWYKNGLSPDVPNESNMERIFLICPIPKATDQQRAEMIALVQRWESKGYKVHYPTRDTNQSEPLLYNIAMQNSLANARAGHTALYYRQDGIGTFFDLGVAYYCWRENPSRTFTVMNEGAFTLDENYAGDQIVMQFRQKAKSAAF